MSAAGVPTPTTTGTSTSTANVPPSPTTGQIMKESAISTGFGLAAGAVTDYNICWDLDGTAYMPQESPTADGLWSVNGDGDLQPDDV